MPGEQRARAAGSARDRPQTADYRPWVAAELACHEHRHHHQQDAPAHLAQRIRDGEAAQHRLAQKVADARCRFAKQVAVTLARVPTRINGSNAAPPIP